METSDLLLTLAEVSIAFVGFSALVVMLRDRHATGWSYFESIAIQTPILAGLLALFFSLLPLFLAQLPLSEPAVWRISSGALASCLVAVMVRYHLVRGRIAREEPERLRPAAAYTRQGFTIVTAALQLVNLASTPVSWPYLFGLAWLLTFGALFFLRAFNLFRARESNGG